MIVTIDDQVVWDGEGRAIGLPEITDFAQTPAAKFRRSDRRATHKDANSAFGKAHYLPVMSVPLPAAAGPDQGGEARMRFPGR